MAHFIQADGPLDRTYPNEYVHTIPLSWSNKTTKQEVHKSYILNLFGCTLNAAGSCDVVHLHRLSIFMEKVFHTKKGFNSSLRSTQLFVPKKIINKRDERTKGMTFNL